jgi:hypothetical protein
MRRFSGIFFVGAILMSFCGCGGGSGVGPLSITFTSTPVSVPGGTNFVFSVTTQNDTLNRGVNFTLALNEPSNGDTTTPCTTACGALSGQTNTITANGPDIFTSTTTVNYAAPLLPPTPNSLILTATANANASVTITDTFAIGAPQVVVHITNKITNIAPGAPPVTLDAQVLFDTANAGVTWTLTAQGAACSPACGTLSSAQPFSVIFTPPATLPVPPNNTPTITATSVTTTTVSDFDDIRIQASTQPISVSITNPFAQINAGAAGVTINAVVNNDVAGQGVTWSLNPSAQTGALSAEQPLNVLYTPPNKAPQPPNNTPTITATSVADPTKSDSFTFTIAPAAAFQGAYAFVIRGHDESGNNMAAAGSLVADGHGKITAGEADFNASDENGHQSTVAVLGSYETREANDGSQNIRIALENVSPRNGSTSIKFNAEFPLSVSVAGSNGEAPAESDSILFAAMGKITGQSGTRTLTGEIARQNIAALTIGNFGGNVFSVSFMPATVLDPIEAGGFLFLFNREGSRLVPSAVGIATADLGAFDASGRSALTLIFANALAEHYAAYAVSSARLFLVALDTADTSHPTKSGVAQLRSLEH